MMSAASQASPPSCNTGGTPASGLTIQAPQAPLVDGKEHCRQTSCNDQKITAEDAIWWTAGPQKELSRQRLRRRRQIAAKVLRNQSPRPAESDAENHRGRWYPVSACGCVPRAGGLSLEARASGRVDRQNVVYCGSVWTCPECAQRIATHRAAEIVNMIDRARSAGCRVEMVTFTLPHYLSMSAHECMRLLKDSLRRFAGDGTTRRELKSIGYLGQVRSIEVTRGLTSGWHFHAHAVFVFDAVEGAEGTEAKVDFDRSLELKKALYPCWQRAALNSGAPRAPSFKHGLDVRAVWNANDYIAKLPEKAAARDEQGKKRWGAEAELSKAYMKEGRKNSRTPWEILDGAASNEADVALFREYAAATWGRSQIEWSRGDRDLRKMFLDDVDNRSDDEIVYDEPEWVFADEDNELPDVGQENLVVERIQISSADAWRSRRDNFGSIDRASAAHEFGDALSLASALAAEGWILDRLTQLGYGRELHEKSDGTLEERTILVAAEYVARWPAKACAKIRP